MLDRMHEKQGCLVQDSASTFPKQYPFLESTSQALTLHKSCPVYPSSLCNVLQHPQQPSSVRVPIAMGV